MDYSKHGIKKKQRNLRSTGPRAEKKLGFTVFRVFIICFVLLAVIGISAAIGGIKGIIDSSPELNVADVAPKGFKSYIYDQDGKVIQELIGTESNRIYVTIDKIPLNLQNAFIALEDERFRTHNGIDPRGIVRAFFVGLTNQSFSEGASTITQQLLKLSLFEGGEESSLLLKFKRKFQEQYLAMELEKILTKDEILEAYLNTINLGNNCYGVEAAAQYYFNKSCSELTISECAAMAAIAQSPTNNNPLQGEEKNNTRRQKTLQDMLTQNLITQDEFDTAMADDSLYYRVADNTATYQAEQAGVYTYYIDAAINQILADLQSELGLTKAEATKKLYSGGLKVYLAQDQVVQTICDNYYKDDANFPTKEYLLSWDYSYQDEFENWTHLHSEDLAEYLGRDGALDLCFNSEAEAVAAKDAYLAHYKEANGLNETNIATDAENYTISPQVQSSFVLMEQSTGNVLAIVGGRGEKTSSLTFNRATDATRQPGSVFKIVSVYAPAIDACGDSLASGKLDEIYQAYNSEIHNVDEKYTKGYVNFRDAIIVSKNTVATRVLNEDVTLPLAFDYLIDNFHFTTLDREKDAVEGLGLGGITYGVTNLELTASFASIANGGVYMRPVFYTKILDSEDNIILDTTHQEGERAIKATTAYMLIDAMKDVVTDSKGTANATALSGITTAGKTGTTNNRKDLWFVGFSAYYTAGIWFGYDNNESLTNKTSNYYAQQYIWQKIMTDVHTLKGKENQEIFEMPDGIDTKTICMKTGLLPGSGCETATDLIATENVPTEKCDQCKAVYICNVCGGIAGSNSPSSRKKSYSSNSELPGYNCTCKPKETESETGDSTGTDSGTSGTDSGTSGTGGTDSGTSTIPVE